MTKVSIIKTEACYPTIAPYHPSKNYPEYPFGNYISKERNCTYEGVRKLFYQLGYDKDNWNTKAWNPLGFLIKPEMTVVIKPNFVQSRHKQGKDLYSIITHPSVLRVVVDYCWIALRGNGKIIIADAPQYDCNFQELINSTKIDELLDFFTRFKGPDVELVDLRSYWSPWKHFNSCLKKLPGDKKGSMIVNLGEKSALFSKPNAEKLYGAVYTRSETVSNHIGKIQNYKVSRTIMNADVVISVPKLKVHKKVGVTLNVKGLVGITTDKNYLVHYTLTQPSKGGDQYPDDLFTATEELLIKLERWMYDHLLASRNHFLEKIHRSIYWLHNHTTKLLGLKVSEKKRMFDAGNWYGNDSAWRMAVDLMKVFCFTDRNGKILDKPQRKTFSIIDGIIGGENNGPLSPDPVKAGILIAGENMLSVDIVATRIMGFDPMKIKMYEYLLNSSDFDFGVKNINEIDVLSNYPEWRNCLNDIKSTFLRFTPHSGWVGHIEI